MPVFPSGWVLLAWVFAFSQAVFFMFWMCLNKNFFSASSVYQEFSFKNPSFSISSCSIKPLSILHWRYSIWNCRHLLGISWCFITHSEYFLAYLSHSWKWSRGNEPRSGALDACRDIIATNYLIVHENFIFFGGQHRQRKINACSNTFLIYPEVENSWWASQKLATSKRSWSSIKILWKPWKMGIYLPVQRNP